MANQKNSPSVLVSGLGMGMAFIQSLISEIVALGGFDEMLHPLTSDHGKPIVKKLAEVIVNSPWRIPRSLVERLVNAISIVEDGCINQYDTHFWWNRININKTFKIPTIHFNKSEGRFPPVPNEILEQLRNKEICYPLIVEWNGEPHVVISCCELNHGLAVGAKLNDLEIETINLAPAKYFDLER